MAFENDPFGCFVGAAFEQRGAPGGLNVAIKDNIDVAGVPTGAGLGRAGGIPNADAEIVRRLRNASCTLLGKTRMDEIAFGATGENAHWGRTENPAAPGHSPGGSSAGSAAAIAAGYCVAALGTDTLGSVRIPAAYCGLVGLKPSRGLLPMSGITPLSETLDHPGLMARSAAMASRVLAMLTPDRRDEGASNHAPRLAVPDALEQAELDPGIRARFEDALRRRVAAGWRVERCRIPGWDPAATRRAGLLVIEAEAAVTYETLLQTGDPALSPPIRRMLEFGRDCGTARLVRALRTLREAAAGFDAVLRGCDAVAMPTVTAPAFRWGEKPPPNQADLTAPANFGGHPAISAPLEALSDGRPCGLQLVGALGTDFRLLNFAEAFAAPSPPHEPGRRLARQPP